MKRKKSHWSTRSLSPREVQTFYKQFSANQRADLKVTRLPQLTLDALMANRVLAPHEAQALKNEVFRVFRNLDITGRAFMMNATEFGGGVAEMRSDTTSLMQSMGVNLHWLVMDGCNDFYQVTAHIHEALQNRHYRPLEPRHYEYLQLCWVENFERMEREGYFKNTSLLWIDDPQPTGLIPLIRAIYPHIKIIWRCHIDSSDPQPKIARYICDLLEGKLRKGRDDILLALIERKKKAWKLRSAKPRPIDLAIFHRKSFYAGLKLRDGIEVRFMPPAINPISYKNIPVSYGFIDATLRKYNIADPHGIRPPIGVEISRFDPYKGPLEVLTAFVLAVQKLKDPSLQRTCRFVFAGNLPGDNPLGLKLYKSLTRFLENLPVEALPASMRGRTDIRKRIFLLKLEDRRPAISFTKVQREAALCLLENLDRTEDELIRAKKNDLSGKEMNHLEVNALQSIAKVRAQFSSKEGFGLVVSEALVKRPKPPYGVLIATKVGGIVDQLRPNLSFPVSYSEKEVAESLNMYNSFQDTDDAEYWQDIYKQVAKRKSVQKFAEAMVKIFSASTNERKSYNEKACEFALKKFSVHTNVTNILKSMNRVLREG